MPKPGSPEWHARIASLLEEESTHPLRWWYLSFAEPGKFLGAVIVQERGFTSAMQKAHRLAINPGGEVMTHEIGLELPPYVPASMCNRLLTKDEVESIGPKGESVYRA